MKANEADLAGCGGRERSDGPGGERRGRTPSQWEQPAAALADQIADLLGPGQAHLTIRNLSSIPADEIPAIRRCSNRI